MATQEGTPLKARCQFITRNLLSMFQDSTNIPASLAIRELLLETSVCDKLSLVRVAYQGYLQKHGDPETKKRVLALKANEQDELVAAASVLHYDTWTQSQLIDCLNLKNRLKYQFVHKAEQTFAILGIFGFGYGVVKGVRAMTKASLDRVKKMKIYSKPLSGDGSPTNNSQHSI